MNQQNVDNISISNHQEGRIAIIGCARSGTGYMTELFKQFGYFVGHESLQRHGISSWCLVPKTGKRCWGPSSQDLANLNLPYVHQVRHPLKVIASMTTARSDSWRFISRFIPIELNDNLIQNSMKYWYYWNRLAEKRAAFTYQVEEIEKALPGLINIGGFDESRFDSAGIRKIRKDINQRNHHSIAWSCLESEDSELTERIRTLATRYGYKLI